MCNICALCLFTKKTTKRQKFYISRRSRYIYICTCIQNFMNCLRFIGSHPHILTTRINNRFLYSLLRPFIVQWNCWSFHLAFVIISSSLPNPSSSVPKKTCCIAHSIHVWYIYLHLVDFSGINVGKYTSPMDAMDCIACFESPHPFSYNFFQDQTFLCMNPVKVDPKNTCLSFRGSFEQPNPGRKHKHDGKVTPNFFRKKHEQNISTVWKFSTVRSPPVFFPPTFGSGNDNARK